MYSCTFSVLEFPTRMSFRRVINYHRIIEFSWLSEPPLPRAPHFRRRRGKFQAGLVAIKRKNGIDRLRFALVRPRQIRVIIYLTSPVNVFRKFIGLGISYTCTVGYDCSTTSRPAHHARCSGKSGESNGQLVGRCTAGDRRDRETG